MLFTQAALCLSSLVLFASAQGSETAFYKGVKPLFSRTPTTTHRLLMSRDLNKRCTGSCEECFGDGYTLCPDSDIYCYLPGDDYYGLDSCTTDSTATSTADASSSTSTSGTDDICYETGATCASCFGPTYIDCPDGYHCYDPNDPLYDTCPEDDGSSSSGGDSTSSSDTTCADIYGSGSIDCGVDSCYNPDEGDVCCADGYHCEDGYTCSTEVGQCCAPGSLSSGCSGGSSGGLSTSTRGSSSFTTSTSGLSFNTATATNTGSDSSATGVSQIGGNGAGVAGIKKGLLIAAGVGALVL